MPDSMDRCRCRPDLSARFVSHWSIQTSGKSIWTNPLVSCFQEISVWTNALSKVSPKVGIGPWIALPREEPSSERTGGNCHDSGAGGEGHAHGFQQHLLFKFWKVGSMYLATSLS